MKLSTYFTIAEAAAKESKCASMGVGCVIVKNDKVIGTGYNGTVRGYINCNDKFCGRSVEHSNWSQKFEIHSEMNALANCTESVQGCTAIITHSPCFNCTKHLIAFGVTRILFLNRYDNYPSGEWEEILDFCQKTERDFHWIPRESKWYDYKLSWFDKLRSNPSGFLKGKMYAELSSQTCS